MKPYIVFGSYYRMMHDRAVSDVVVVGAGSAGLSCAYHLGNSRPDLKITIIEANVAPGPHPNSSRSPAFAYLFKVAVLGWVGSS
jgi:cation diffusion facilitator CzcD-associated flavoprotein CzcO